MKRSFKDNPTDRQESINCENKWSEMKNVLISCFSPQTEHITRAVVWHSASTSKTLINHPPVPPPPSSEYQNKKKPL
jgi:hypothetical protein